MKKIAVDAMGGDNAPQALVEGVNQAIRDFDDSHFTLDEEMQKTIRIMEDDYKSIYYNLHKYLIELK